MGIRDPDALWLTLVTAVVFLIYGYHFYRASRKQIEERSTRSFRNFFIAIMIQVGLLRILIGSAVRAFPNAGWLIGLQTIVAPLLTLLLLSGGFVLWWTWRHEDRDNKRLR